MLSRYAADQLAERITAVQSGKQPHPRVDLEGFDGEAIAALATRLAKKPE